MQNSVKEDRYKYIGGSDIPIIMGVSPYKTRFQLLLEKAQVSDDDFEGNAYTEYGNAMEGKIRDCINSMGGFGVFTEGKHVEDGDPIGIRCHTDGENEQYVLEVKTTSEIYNDYKEYKVYLPQLVFYMRKTGKKYGLLAVYERPDDMSEEFDLERLHLYVIRMEDEFIQALSNQIEKAVAYFISDLRRVIDNPFIAEEDLMPTEVVAVSNQIVAWEQKLADMKKVEADIKSMKDTLKKLMEAYGIKAWETPGGVKITLVEDAPDKETEEEYFDEEGLKESHPKIYKKYCKTRQTVKKGKKGYVRITLPKE